MVEVAIPEALTHGSFFFGEGAVVGEDVVGDPAVLTRLVQRELLENVDGDGASRWR